jgi:hypothetical protein
MLAVLLTAAPEGSAGPVWPRLRTCSLAAAQPRATHRSLKRAAHGETMSAASLSAAVQHLGQA